MVNVCDDVCAVATLAETSNASIVIVIYFIMIDLFSNNVNIYLNRD